MFWQDSNEQQTFEVDETVIDLLFSIKCRELAVDHAYHLSQAILSLLPWIKHDPRTAIHNIHLAGTQNGWERPDPGQGQNLMLSHRTKLVIRTPSEKSDEIQARLQGAELMIGEFPMVVGKSKTRKLSKQGTIFTRFLVLEDGELDDETAFMRRVIGQLAAQGIPVKKALAGICTEIMTEQGPISTQSIMFSGLSPQHSVKLQQEGLGPGRHMGCGIFIPHKGIESVKQAEDD